MKQIQNHFDEEDVKGFEKDPDKDLDDEKNLFVSFDDMDFCVLGPNQAPPSFNSYDPKGFFTVLPVSCEDNG